MFTSSLGLVAVMRRHLLFKIMMSSMVILQFFGHGELVFFAYPETSVALDSNLHSTSSL
jgi:uncharacterized membrane protein YkvI